MNWIPDNRRRPHHDNEVWQLGKRLLVEIYRVTAAFPKDERYGLSAQMRRATISIPSNVAAGKGRKSDAQFLRYLYMARGSLEELDTQMEIADELGYLEESNVSKARKVFGDLSPGARGADPVDTIRYEGIRLSMTRGLEGCAEKLRCFAAQLLHRSTA